MWNKTIRSASVRCLSLCGPRSNFAVNCSVDNFWREPITLPSRTYATSPTIIRDWCGWASVYQNLILLLNIRQEPASVTLTHEADTQAKRKFLRTNKDHFSNDQKPNVRSSKSEYILDDDGVMYKRRQTHQHQLVVPKALVQDIIKANHNPVYIGHPGMKRTFDLISLRYWWPSMRQLSHVTRVNVERRTENL